MRYWLLALIICAAVGAGLYLPTRQRALPAMKIKGTAHILYAWQRATKEYVADFDQLPPREPIHKLIDALHRDNPLEKAYFTEEGDTHIRLFEMLPTDAWENQLVFQWDDANKTVLIISPGPDGELATADDIRSDQVEPSQFFIPEEYQNPNLKKKKSKDKEAAPTAPAEPKPESPPPSPETN